MVDFRGSSEMYMGSDGWSIPLAEMFEMDAMYVDTLGDISTTTSRAEKAMRDGAVIVRSVSTQFSGTDSDPSSRRKKKIVLKPARTAPLPSTSDPLPPAPPLPSFLLPRRATVPDASVTELSPFLPLPLLSTVDSGFSPLFSRRFAAFFSRNLRRFSSNARCFACSSAAAFFAAAAAAASSAFIFTLDESASLLPPEAPPSAAAHLV
mmetsp:Transcript_12062/g.38302  ORF Transcript_12062/g.38302 Transcript_12062/m.38302 type:complete len:207 (-) Transcript_12062:1540-2160(-)